MILFDVVLAFFGYARIPKDAVENAVFVESVLNRIIKIISHGSGSIDHDLIIQAHKTIKQLVEYLRLCRTLRRSTR